INLEAPPVPTDTADDERDEAEESAQAATQVVSHTASLGNQRPRAPRLETSCGQVVHVGDSTSIGLMSSAYQPNKKNWVDAQYRNGGASDVGVEVSGARSVGGGG